MDDAIDGMSNMDDAVDGMSNMDDDSAMMSMGTIDVFWFPKLYWIFVGSVIAAFSLAYLIQCLLYHQRCADTCLILPLYH